MGDPGDLGPLRRRPGPGHLVAGRLHPVDQPGLRQQARSGTDGRHLRRILRQCADGGEEIGVIHLPPGAKAAGDHHDVEFGGIGKAMIGDRLRPGAAAHRPGLVGDHDNLDPVLEHPEHFQRPEHVEQLEPVEQHHAQLLLRPAWRHRRLHGKLRGDRRAGRGERDSGGQEKVAPRNIGFGLVAHRHMLPICRVRRAMAAIPPIRRRP